MSVSLHTGGNMAHIMKDEFSDDISTLDYTQICRACLLQKENLASIFSEKLVCDKVISIVDVIKACASIQIFKGDGFPSQLCSNCFNQMLQAYAFRQLCENSDITLHNNLYKNVRNNSPILEDTESALQDDENSITVKEETKCENQTVKKESEKCYQNVNKKTSKLKKTENTDCKSSFQCQQCDSLFESNIILRDHRREKHPYKKKEKVCSICSKSIIARRFAQHMRTHTGEKPFACNVCGLAFSINGNLTRHKMLHTREQNSYKQKKKICPICSKSIISWKLKEHMRSHTQEKPFACDDCDLMFSIKGNLTRHKSRVHTGERPHTCLICNKGFTRSFALAEHLRIHTHETPFECAICSQKFSMSGAFRLHIKKHCEPVHDKNDNQKTYGLKREIKFLCSECGKGFINRSNLILHSKIHTGVKSHHCADCGKSFAQISSLRAHSVIHSEIKPYQCTFCDKLFNHLVNLKTHLLVHTGEKPFSCFLCEKVFTQRHHLTYHMRTHSGEKPYECSFCGKRFALKNNMTVHVRTHTGETPYHCSVCGKGFYHSSSMKKHQKGHGNKINTGKKIKTAARE